MATVAVTGPSGHIGANLVRALLADGHRVRVLVRRRAIESLAGLELETVHGDARERAGHGKRGRRGAAGPRAHDRLLLRARVRAGAAARADRGRARSRREGD